MNKRNFASILVGAGTCESVAFLVPPTPHPILCRFQYTRPITAVYCMKLVPFIVPMPSVTIWMPSLPGCKVWCRYFLDSRPWRGKPGTSLSLRRGPPNESPSHPNTILNTIPATPHMYMIDRSFDTWWITIIVLIVAPAGLGHQSPSVPPQSQCIMAVIDAIRVPSAPLALSDIPPDGSDQQSSVWSG